MLSNGKKLLLLIPGEGKKFSPLNESLVHNWTLAILHLRGKQFWQENIHSDISLAAFYNKTVIWSCLAWNVRRKSDGDGFTDRAHMRWSKGAFSKDWLARISTVYHLRGMLFMTFWETNPKRFTRDGMFSEGVWNERGCSLTHARGEGGCRSGPDPAPQNHLNTCLKLI